MRVSELAGFEAFHEAAYRRVVDTSGKQAPVRIGQFNALSTRRPTPTRPGSGSADARPRAVRGFAC